MKKFLKVMGIIIFSLAIVIGISGYYFIKNFDLNKYKSYASQLVEDQLGRKFAINGEASIGISLVPTLVLEDVELANASWASNPQMLKVKKLELKFALMPLLHKQIVVDKAILINPEVYLEVSKSGAANWDFPGLKANKTVKYESSGFLIKSAMAAENEVGGKTDLSALAGFAARQIRIESGLVQYKDDAKNQVSEVVINEIDLSVPGVDEPITLAADVIFDGQNINAKATLGSLNLLLDGKKPFPVKLAGTAYGVDVKLIGSVGDMFGNIRYVAETDIYNPSGNFDAPETTLKAMINGDMKKVAADISSLNVAGNVITGTVNANISSKIPAIIANLKSNKINLPSLMANPKQAWNISVIGTAQAADMVPATAIPYNALKGINAKVQLEIADLIIDKAMEAKNVLADANLRDGVLTVSKLRLDFGGGEIDANAVVNANTQSVALNALSKNVLLQNLHKEFAVDNGGDFGILKGGATDLQINLSGTGANYRQLVQGLNGQVIAIVNPSVVQTGSLNFMSGNILTEILNLINFKASKSKDLDLNCAVVRADLSGGRAVFPKGIAISSNQLSLVSDGNINLINDKLDFTLQPFSGKVTDSNVGQLLSSFVKIKGTLQNPKIALDDKETIKAVVSMAATGGTTYLGSKLLLDGNASPCYTALIGTAYANKFPKPTGVDATAQKVYQGTTKTIETDLKALKNSAKDFLKAFKPIEKDL